MKYSDQKVTDTLQLAQWFLSPGKTMHASWWEELSLTSWASVYGTNNILTRQIDALIIHRGHLPAFPATLNGMTERGQVLSRLSWKLPYFILALGVLLLECPDYLIRREYRTPLAEQLGEEQVQLLWMLWRGGEKNPALSADELVLYAHQLGYQAVELCFATDPVWQVLRLHLPVPPPEEHEVHMTFDKEAIFSELQRLERFL